MRMHRFLCMASDAERFMVLSPVVVFLPVHMVSVKVFVVRGLTQINPTFLVFAPPDIFRSVAPTGFTKPDAVVVDRRGIVGVQWQGCDLIFRVRSKVFFDRKGIIYLLVVPVMFVSFVLQVSEAQHAYFKSAYFL